MIRNLAEKLNRYNFGDLGRRTEQKPRQNNSYNCNKRTSKEQSVGGRWRFCSCCAVRGERDTGKPATQFLSSLVYASRDLTKGKYYLNTTVQRATF